MHHYFYWDINPDILALGPIHIRWYGLLFVCAFLAGHRIFVWIYKKENKDIADLDQLLTAMALGTIIGARLGHCLFYEPGFYLSHPLEILKIWQGGLASHGATIGIMLSLYLYSRKHPNQPYQWLLSRMAIPVALGGALVRTGNFFNSEIVGTPSEVPWAVIFAAVDQSARHPSQLYEATSYLFVFALLLAVYLRPSGRENPALLLGLFFFAVFSIRFFIEFTKEPQVAFERSLPLDLGQLLSLPLIALGLVLLLQWWRWRLRQRTVLCPS